MAGHMNMQIDKLNGSNYRTWKFNMKMLLIEMELWNYINGVVIRLPANNEDFDRKDCKALSTIALGINPDQQIHIMDCTTAKEAWTLLEGVFEPKTRARILQLKKQFIQIKMEEKDSMTSYLCRLKICCDNLREAGSEVNDKDIAYSMLSGLPESYEGIIMMFSNMSDEDFTSIKVKQTLLTEFERRDERSKINVIKEALHSGSSRSIQRDKYEPSKRKFMGKCYKCGIAGHIAKFCKANMQNRKSQVCKFVNNTENKDEVLLCNNNKKLGEDSWLLDSGATNHVCNKRELFCKFVSTSPESISTANSWVKATGVGDVYFDMYLNGKTKRVKFMDVLFVPEIKRNLLSVSKITDKGKTVILHDSEATIRTINNEIIARAFKENGLYVIQGDCSENKIKPEVFQINQKPMEVWHKRFCHVNENFLRTMVKNDLVKGLDLSLSKKPDLCDDCCITKSTKATHKRLTEKNSRKLLELVHTDICGPIQVDSCGGARYFLTFIDDFSRKIVVYCLRTKNEVLKYFKIYRARVEREKGMKILRLRSDNGLEYCNKEFSEEMKSLGIKHELTNVYSPQMNGIAERANRTLLELARASLKGANLPQKFWAEAVTTASYIKNRSLNSSIGNKIPEEVWTDRKPSVRHLRAYGCVGYAHIPKHKRKKIG